MDVHASHPAEPSTGHQFIDSDISNIEAGASPHVDSRLKELSPGLHFLIGDHPEARRSWKRAALFVAWLALITWFCTNHVFWRDEVRALSLALAGNNVGDMLRTVHGEGHPALWYLILRGGHSLFPYREVLPVAAALVGISAMAIFSLFAPFRTALIAVVLFSFYGAFEYVAIARNYGLSVLVIFAIAALYGRTKNSLWLGVLVATLCNTNVPSCFLAAGFLAFRFVEMLSDRTRPTRRDLIVFGGNALLAAIGAYLCFRTVYPTFNDAAIAPRLQDLTPVGLLKALADGEWAFSHLVVESFHGIPLNAIILAISCFGLVRKPAGFVASIVVLIALKLFYYFIYPSYYRHEMLSVIFMLSLFWMVAEGAGGTWRRWRFERQAELTGVAVFVGLLIFQTGKLIAPISVTLNGAPFSQSAAVGQLLHRPELSRAIVMGDPDTMLEPVAYYADNPLWFLRQQRFGNVVRLSNNARHLLTLDDVLNDAKQLHQKTGRPVVFLSHIPLQDRSSSTTAVMFYDSTRITPDSVRRFREATRLIARLRPSQSGEDYEAYLYPR